MTNVRFSRTYLASFLRSPLFTLSEIIEANLLQTVVRTSPIAAAQVPRRHSISDDPDPAVKKVLDRRQFFPHGELARLLTELTETKLTKEAAGRCPLRLPTIIGAGVTSAFEH